MISFFVSYTELALVFAAIGLVITVPFLASIGVIKRNLRNYAEPATLKLLASTEAERDWWHAQADELMWKNRQLVAALNQSLFYDQEIQQLMTRRIENERDASVLGAQTETRVDGST